MLEPVLAHVIIGRHFDTSSREFRLIPLKRFRPTACVITALANRTHAMKWIVPILKDN